MTGAEVKAIITGSGVRLWEVANALGIADATFSRRLRKPFNNDEVEQIKTIVAELSDEKKPCK